MKRVASKARVIVDLDAIVADFLGGVLDQHEAETGKRVHPDEVTKWEFKFDCGRSLHHYFGRPGFFRGLKPIDGAVEGVKRLREMFDVLIVSSATLDHVPAEKYQWLREHMPWFPEDDVFLARRKGVFRADVIIDDYPKNIDAFLAENIGLAYTLKYAYNKDHDQYRFHAENWAQLVDAVVKDYGTSARRYYWRNRDKCKAASEKWRKQNDDRCFAHHLRRKYGMTFQEFETLLHRQGGRCAICSGPPNGRGSRLTVDHDHETGVVRALLCDSCNRMLGDARDQTGILRKAIEYLQLHSAARNV